MQTIVDGLLDERMRRHIALARDVLRARDLIRKHRREQIFAFHALQLRRDLAPAGVARQRERVGRVPAPAHAEERRVEQRLDQHVLGRRRFQIAPDFIEREAVAARQRQHDRVLGCRRLQLEVERAAKALPQRQAPRAIHAAAERRVDDELRAAGFVEKALHDERVLRRQHGERGARTRQIIDDLPRRFGIDARRLREPRDRFVDAALREPRVDLRAQPRDGVRKLVAAAGRFAQPERDVRRLAVRVLHAHAPAFHAHDPVRRIAELKDVARETLDGEILVHRADLQALRFEDHGEIGVVGNRAARGDGRQLAAAPAAQRARDRVAMHIRRAHALSSGIAFRERAQHGLVVRAIERRIRIRARDALEERVLAPLAARDFGGDLLRQHVERRVRNGQRVEFAAPHAVEQRRAFDEIVARGRKKPSFRHAADLMPGAPDALQKRADRTGRADLADEIDIADIDAQLKRRRGDQHAQFAALQALLRVQTMLAREAAVMRGDRFLAEPLGQMPRRALGHAARVHEDERGAMLPGKLRETVVDALPRVVGHDRFERHRRDVEREIALADVAHVDDLARLVFTDEKLRDEFDRLLRRRQTNAHRPLSARFLAERVEPRERQAQVRAALGPRDRMDFVDDHRSRGREHRAAGIGRQQHVERFRRRHEDMRRTLSDRVALLLGRVAGAHGRANLGRGHAGFAQSPRNARERFLQIHVDVVGQRLQRRDVHDACLVRQRPAAREPVTHQFVDGREKRGERLARARRRGDECRAARVHERPRARLRGGRRGKACAEPFGDSGMKAVQSVGGGSGFSRHPDILWALEKRRTACDFQAGAPRWNDAPASPVVQSPLRWSA
ncbi:hypothetical protein AWB82_06876 [Caballeronia glebae]|uniref:Uncharacterized protein n=1 Tax=Caballeronia glebae TaxID=1777143 RepID=A0A158DN22_9BURK|nr:hypothetical protein AWB82_06876 [Caballeronia glebae]